jgi:hypothetical protein
MNSKLIIIGVIIFIVIILIIIILKFTSSSKNPIPPPPVCGKCEDYQTCDIATGQCVNKTSCGPKIVPTGSECTINDLTCNLNTYQWECTKCRSGYEGKLCNCDMEKKKNYITNVCSAKIPVCQDSGDYIEESANKCNQINSYLNFLDTNVTDYCSKSCPNNGEASCLENPTRIVCQNFCRTTGPSEFECNNCLDTESCICDARTGNQWTCQPTPPPQSGCPPKPIPSVCYNSAKEPLDLTCVPCAQGGWIEYCQGSASFPRQCMTLGKEVAQGIDIFTSNSLPVYPTIDNDKCKKDGTISTDFLNNYDRSYALVDNPSAFTRVKDGNLEIQYFNKDDPTLMYYPSGQPNVNCWWDDHPTCTLNGQQTGNAIQQCGYGNEQHDCKINEDNDRLKRMRCDCYSYVSNIDKQYKPYLGNTCQYSDNDTCNSLGTVDNDGHCSCIENYNGPNCQYSRQETCNSVGTPNFDGTCKCDYNYAGSNCQYSRQNTCNDAGEPQNDGTCVCINSSWAGSQCQYSNMVNCNNHGQVNNNGECNCNPNFYQSMCVAYMNVTIVQFASRSPLYANSNNYVTWDKCNGGGPCSELNVSFNLPDPAHYAAGMPTDPGLYMVYDNVNKQYWSNCYTFNTCDNIGDNYNLVQLRTPSHANNIPVLIRLVANYPDIYVISIAYYFWNNKYNKVDYELPLCYDGRANGDKSVIFYNSKNVRPNNPNSNWEIFYASFKNWPNSG